MREIITAAAIVQSGLCLTAFGVTFARPSFDSTAALDRAVPVCAYPLWAVLNAHPKSKRTTVEACSNVGKVQTLPGDFGNRTPVFRRLGLARRFTLICYHGEASAKRLSMPGGGKIFNQTISNVEG